MEEGGRDGGREGGREGWREGGMEGGENEEGYPVIIKICAGKGHSVLERQLSVTL